MRIFFQKPWTATVTTRQTIIIIRWSDGFEKMSEKGEKGWEMDRWIGESIKTLQQKYYSFRDNKSLMRRDRMIGWRTDRRIAGEKTKGERWEKIMNDRWVGERLNTTDRTFESPKHENIKSQQSDVTDSNSLAPVRTSLTLYLTVGIQIGQNRSFGNLKSE